MMQYIWREMSDERTGEVYGILLYDETKVGEARGGHWSVAFPDSDTPSGHAGTAPYEHARGVIDQLVELFG